MNLIFNLQCRKIEHDSEEIYDCRYCNGIVETSNETYGEFKCLPYNASVDYFDATEPAIPCSKYKKFKLKKL
jgi:hypothetical protein